MRKLRRYHQNCMTPQRLTQRFQILFEPEMYRELHRRAGEQMISVGELIRRYVREGLERDQSGSAETSR